MFGAPIDMGNQLLRFTRVDGLGSEAKAGAPGFLTLAGGGEVGVKHVGFFNHLLYAAASETTAPVRVDRYVSEEDAAYKSMRRFWKALHAHPTITCELHPGDYGPHHNIKDFFWAWVRRELV